MELKKKRLNDIETMRRKEEVERARNPTSSNYLCAKFEKEYRVVIENMAKEEYEWEETQPIPYQPCGSILTTLGFLP